MMRRRVVPALWIAAVLAVCCSGTVALAAAGSTRPHVAGTWKGKYSGAFSGTFTLTWIQAGSKLTGSISLSSPKGKYGITGNLTRKGIKFGAVAVGATYTGSVSGTTMSGNWSSPQGGGTWSAQKVVPQAIDGLPTRHGPGTGADRDAPRLRSMSALA